MRKHLRGTVGIVILITIVAIALVMRMFQNRHDRVLLQVGGETITAEIVDTPLARTKGLSGREKLEAGHGMLFVYSPAQRAQIWMKDMRFAIDIIWIRDGVVVDIAPNVPPPASKGDPLPIYTPRTEADHVLEIGPGFVERVGLKIGDAVDIAY